MTDQNTPYLSYLLRLWVVKNDHNTVWHCSVENVQTGQQQGFANIEALCKFLREATFLGQEVEFGSDELSQ